jgi:hypothetical protein
VIKTYDKQTQALRRNERNEHVLSAVAAIRAKQFQQVQAEVQQGRAPSWEDFPRAVDLAVLQQMTDPRQAQETVAWLKRFASPGGWEGYMKHLDRWDNELRRGEGYAFNIYVTPQTRTENTTQEEIRRHAAMEAQYYRRLGSFVGPQAQQRGVVAWGRQDRAGQ